MTKVIAGGMIMTSGFMKCPKCGRDFQYAGYRTDSNMQDIWVEYEEPWKCWNCASLIVVDHDKGYGLKVIPHAPDIRKGAKE